MPDLLNIGASGLRVAQIALDTTGNNISNVNTPGYSREQTQIGTQIPQRMGSYYIGQGAQVIDIQRSYSTFLTQQVQNSAAAQSQYSAYHGIAARLVDLLGSGSSSLQSSLDQFFGALQDVATNPSSVPTRQAMLGKTQALISNFHSLASQFGNFQKEINLRLGNDVASINSLGQSIAKLNAQIAQAMGSGGTPNELLDQRDATIQKLAKLVGVQVTQQSDGTVNVSLGKGQPLVTGAQAVKLQTTSSPFDSSRSEIALASTGQVISGQMTGGDVGGLLSVRDSVVVPALNQLGRLAMAFASSVNAQNKKGMDLHGQLGGKLLSIGGPRVLPASVNTGTAVITASIANVSQLTSSDYILSRTASGWTLIASDGSNVPMAGAGTTASPFTAAGLSLVVSGTAQVGDRYQIQPTRSLAQGLGLVSNDPTRIAAAVPVRSAAASANTGKASIGSPSITNISNPNLLNPVSIQFTTPTSYQINGAGSYAYTSGTPLAINGWQVAITGTPASGDQFTVQSNAGGVGDNGNALLMTGLASANLLDNGSSTLGAAYGQMIAGTGTLTAQSQTQLTTATAVANQAQAAQQSVAGVNLNEEAAKLLRFQQSFQAAAHVISTAQTLFQTLLQAVR